MKFLVRTIFFLCSIIFQIMLTCEFIDIQNNSGMESRGRSTKQRKINNKQNVLFLKLKRGRAQNKPFLLVNDKDVFKRSSKKQLDLSKQKLIDHECDDDCDTDEEVITEHISECLKELKRAILEFIDGDALKLCRNARNEFSGIEPIEILDFDDKETSALSSWYDVVSENS